MSSGLHYKPIMIINDDSSIVNKLETLLIDDTRVVIYDCHIFIVQATRQKFKKISSSLWTTDNKLVRLATKQASSAQSIVN
jgi:hypothetical protein